MGIGLHAQQGRSIPAAVQEEITQALSRAEGFVTAGNRNEAARNYNQAAQAYWDYDHTDEALQYFGKSLTLNQELGNMQAVKSIYNFMGLIYTDRKQYDRSLEMFNKSLAIIRQSGRRDANLVEGLKNVSFVYESQGKPDQAIPPLEEAFRIAQEMNNLNLMRTTAFNLADNYRKTGNKQKELEYLDIFNMLDKEVVKSEAQDAKAEAAQMQAQAQQQVIASQQQTLQIQEQVAGLSEALKTKDSLAFILQQQNMILEKDKEIQLQNEQIRLTRERNLRYAILTVVGILLLLGLGVWQLYRYRQQRALFRLEQMRVKELEQIDKLKDQFLANTSHELRTPLNGIIGIAESLVDGSAQGDPTDWQENLELIISSGRRLSNLVNDILDFSKLRNHDLVLATKALDLRSLTEVVLKINEPSTRGKDIRLINDITPSLPLAWGDEERLEQILHNLIGNAIKFTDKGSVRVHAREVNGMIEVSVSDTGIGIPESKFETIFQEFEQVDGSITRAYGGTGLGLVIARQLVELHGGLIRVESQLGQGSTFIFTLPRAAGEQVAQPATARGTRTVRALTSPLNGNGHSPESTPATPQTGGDQVIRILSVDDEAINQKVLANHLSGSMFEITQAMNGEEALQAMESGKNFDLVVLDVMMPRMSGYEVCRRIREKHLPSELPIIMITAKNQVEDLVQGLATGANDYLAKPFSKDEFLARVKTHVNLHRINRATSKFVPTAFLKSLGKESITEVLLGDQVQRDVTVMFSDIRNYTGLAEKMTPDETFKFVNAYHGRMGPVITNNRGFVNQYLGDGIMAVFPEGAEDALKASIGMQEILREYNVSRLKRQRVPIGIGIGLHTGALIMGIIGDSQRMDAATISDTVNTASRMEGLTKYYGAKILLSEQTLAGIQHPDWFHFRFLGKVQVKGKQEPLKIYECLDGLSPVDFDLALQTRSTFQEAMDHYLGREFDLALLGFKQVLTDNPQDSAAHLFMNRAAQNLSREIPADWTGVELMEVK
ncbi:MAG: ATP-binding protein [Bacteroidia bacterium]|nr:ATP-binding protein [Bacteroidia bacterium]